MAKITKKVDRLIPPSLRSQQFNNLDAVQGDVLMVEDSLGHPASKVRIEAVGGSVGVRFNVYHTVYPRRPGPEDNIYNFLYSGVEIKLATADFIAENGQTISLERFLPVKDIELVTVSGNFDVFVT